jgi:indolepyruvate ferredoxin oxidoreductase
VRLLARGKFLRGTLFDPLRWAEVRKLERELAGEYRAAIETALTRLDADNYAQVCRLAALPDSVRGYEEIKLRRVAAYRAELDAALAAL